MFKDPDATDSSIPVKIGLDLGPCADCPEPAIVGLRGTWLCLAHFEARLEALVRMIREA